MSTDTWGISVSLPEDLVRDLEEAPERVRKFNQVQFRRMAMGVMGEVKAKMPRDTGTAANSWGIDGSGGIFYMNIQGGGSRIEHVQGGVYYIEYLEEGSSQQQPIPGWIARIISSWLDRYIEAMGRLFS